MKIENGFAETVFSTTKTISAYEPMKRLFELVDAEKVDEEQKKIMKEEFGDIESFEKYKYWKNIAWGMESIPSFSDIKQELIDSFKTNYVTALYWYCPQCGHPHLFYEYVTPLQGWNKLINLHANRIAAQYAVDKNLDRYSCSTNYSIHGIIEQHMLYTARDLLYDNISEDESRSLKMQKASFCKDIYDTGAFSSCTTISDFENDENGIVFRCPSCNFKIPTKRNKNPGELQEPYKFFSLDRTKDWITKNVMDSSYEIWSDEGKPMVTLSIVKLHIYPNLKGKIHIVPASRRITFNTETGQTYVFREMELKSKKPVPLDSNGLCAQRISNVTYGTSYWFNLNNNEIVQKTADAICDKKGIPHIIINSLKVRNSPIKTLARINRFGAYGKDFVDVLMMAEHKDFITKKDMTKIFSFSKNPEEFIKEIQRNKVKGKKRIKLYAKNPLLFCFEEKIKNLGFQDNNIILSIMENIELTMTLVSMCYSFYYNYDNNYIQPIRYISSFIHDYAMIKSEAEIYNKVVNSKGDFLRDIASFYIAIKKRIELTDELKKVLFSGTLREMHDKMYKILLATEDSNFAIPYSEKEMVLNCRSGEYTFTLAKTSLEMKEVGEVMHICVGTYAQKAAQKFCLIVFMKDANGKLAACLEISPDMSTLFQIKDYCNAEISEEKRSAAKRYIEGNKLNYRRCFDVERSHIIECTNIPETFEHLEINDEYHIFENPKEVGPINIYEDIFIGDMKVELKSQEQNQRRTRFTTPGIPWF